MKIVCCKHSAARTGVEQAADTGPMFKGMKALLKTMENPHAATNSIFHDLETKINHLEYCNVMLLPSHKKKAILTTVSKLLSLTGKSHSLSNVKKGIILNGQIDSVDKLVPSLCGTLNTYRGNINNTCLKDKQWIFDKFYEEMYTTGVIKECTFDSLSVPIDTNRDGFPVERDHAIHQENR